MTAQPLTSTPSRYTLPTPALYLSSGGGVIQDPTLETLPPLPVDEQGRHVSWVLLASTPGMWYWPHDSNDIADQFFVDVDDAWFEHQLSEFGRMTASGYAPPIRINHVPAGTRNGFVVALDVWEDPRDEERKLIAAVVWTIPDVAAQIESGALAYTSPGFKTFADDSGHLYEGALNEVSICDAPYQKHLCGGRNRHILNTETPTETRPMADEPTQAPDEGGDDSNTPPMLTREDVVEMIAEAMQEYMDKPAADDPESEDSGDDDDKPSPEMVELSELRAQVNALTEEKARAQFAQEYPVGHVITLSADLRDTLYALHTSNPEAFATLSEHAKAPAQPAAVELSEGRTPAIPTPSIAWGKRHGTNTGAPTGNDAPEMSLEERKRELMTACRREAGGDASKMMRLYTERTATLS